MSEQENATQTLPLGFSGHKTGDAAFRVAQQNQQNKQPTELRFAGRRGGPGMGQTVEKPKEAKKTLSRLLRYFGQEKKLLLLLIGAVLLVTACSLLAPAMQGSAIDNITRRQWPRLWKLLLILLAVYLVQMLCTLAQTLLSARLSQKIVQKMRGDLFRKIVNLPIPYIDTHSSGDIMSRMTNDVENISTTISQSLGSLFSSALVVVGTIAMMFRYCWQLTLITLVTVLITVIVTKGLSGVMRRVYRKRSQVLGQLNGHAEEMITGYASIVAYNRQPDVMREFDQMSEELTRVGIRAEILGGSMGPVMNCISNIGFVIVAVFGGYYSLVGLITIGTISAFIVYAKQFSRPINEIAQLYGSVQTAIAGAERVFELMDQPDEDKSGMKEMTQVRGQISFRQVNFSYTPEKQVLHNFNLEVKPGQKIALVGATGSGKTTVVNLLMRFYDVDSGQILVDGTDIRDIRCEELRKNIAIVLQDTLLFSDTIGRNIKYADQGASDARMVRAAEMSNSAYFIDRLAGGYDTFLKQAGANLSQGQKQLLNIARAVLADPKILILDEATSSVDTRTEKHIQDAMVNLMKDRTSLIIAHRLSTIQDADQIVVLDQGRIAESGTHAQLLAQKGRYYALYQTQFAGDQT